MSEQKRTWLLPTLGIVSGLVIVVTGMGLYLLDQHQRKQLLVEVTIDYPGATAEECYDLAATTISPRFGGRGALVDATDYRVTVYVTNAEVQDRDAFLADVNKKLLLVSALPAGASIGTPRLLESHDGLAEVGKTISQGLEIQINRAATGRVGLAPVDIADRVNQIAPADMLPHGRLAQIQNATIEANGQTFPLAELVSVNVVARPVRITAWQ